MPRELFTSAEWPALTTDVVNRMSAHVVPFTTPISQVLEHEYGEHWGSGSYIALARGRGLLTNEHVAAKLQTHSLGYRFHGDDHYFRFRHPCPACGAPTDAALARIDDQEWRQFPHRAMPVAPTLFAAAHAPAPSELFFLIGYSGDRAKFTFGNLVTPGTPYLTRECALPDDTRCLPQFHYAVDYNPAHAVPVKPDGRPLPLPPGLSGSLVWNTRVVEQRLRGQRWSPEDARITGIVWGWPSNTCLVATKVEHMQLAELSRLVGP